MRHTIFWTMVGGVVACGGPIDTSTIPCTDGATRPAGDGCNTCVCSEGDWACTQIACEPVCNEGDVKPAGDGCNTCSCFDGEWACTRMACECTDGETKVAGDGCNTCTCGGGAWLCTEKACGPIDCPPPREIDGGCPAVEGVARNPRTGTCCLYGTACTAPEDWPMYPSVDSCEAACIEGEVQPAGDGCNSCACTGGTWVCTLIAC